jgi:hypothetical protein
MATNAALTPQGTTPTYTLFDSGAVVIATFFGTPVVGSALMAVNYRRLGQGGKAFIAVVVGIVITGLAILLGWNLPQSVSYLVALALLIVMRQGAERLQGAAIADHVQRGGRLGSKWLAFGLGAAFCVVLFGGIFAVVYFNNDTSVKIGSKDEVYYSGTATKADAQALGDALKKRGYMQDQGADVILDKGKDGTIVSFIVKEGFWDQAGTLSTFEEIGRQVAPLIGGFPIKVRLLDSSRDVKKESTIGKEAIDGNDHVYYIGTATESDAQALGQELKSLGFFSGKGSDVFLAKHSDGTVISFVVGDGVWEDATYVGDFEKIVREAAPKVGGLPVRLHLDSTSLEVKKDELIN